MIYRRRRTRHGLVSGFFRVQGKRSEMAGVGDGDFIRLRDEYGTEWRGQAERQGDDTITFRFSDSDGNHVSGISDGYGIILRDAKGHSWRGFID